jgi:cobalt-zinc-cadmium efflux system protein
MSGDGHSHRSGALPDNRRRVFWALLLTAVFAVAEIVGGVLSGSLALLSDAGHMVTDSAALGLAWFAFRLALKKADLRRSYGYHRFQVIAAFVNGLAMIAIALWITIEAVRRFIDPVDVIAAPMLVIACLGLLVNIAAFLVLHGGDRHDLNMRGAALHVMGDMLGSIAAILAALIILRTGWMPIDPLLSLGVAALISRSALVLVRESGHVLLEGTPEHVAAADMRDRLMATVPGVEDVHHIHIWSLTGTKPVVTLHAAVAEDADRDVAMRGLHAALLRIYGVSHATIQIEQGRCMDEILDPKASRGQEVENDAP